MDTFFFLFITAPPARHAPLFVVRACPPPRPCPRSWFDAGTLEELDPAAILGIPALAVFDTLYRSAERVPHKNVLCCPNGSLCNNASRPHGGIADAFWPRLMGVKAETTRLSPFQSAELDYVRVQLCTGGGSEAVLGPGARQALEASQTLPRRAALNGLCAAATRLSLQLSRLRELQQRLPQTFQQLSATPEPNPPRDPVIHITPTSPVASPVTGPNACGLTSVASEAASPTGDATSGPGPSGHFPVPEV